MLQTGNYLSILCLHAVHTTSSVLQQGTIYPTCALQTAHRATSVLQTGNYLSYLVFTCSSAVHIATRVS